MNDEYATLAKRIRESLDDSARVCKRAKELRDRAVQSGDDGYWDGVALNLHGFYAGIEQVLESIAQIIDDNAPSGPQWHRDLLLQLSTELPGVRPAVITRDTQRALDKYRGFRHVVRNVYAFNLRQTVYRN